MIPLLSSLLLVTALATASVHPNQRISDGELQRFTYAQRFPLGCQDATLTANRLRAKPTTDPSQLLEVANTYRACANGPYGQGSNALANKANFAAAAALLLASRYDTPGNARDEAAAARALADAIADYRRPESVRTPAFNNDPSPYRTDAGRIARDAAALLAADSDSTNA